MVGHPYCHTNVKHRRASANPVLLFMTVAASEISQLFPQPLPAAGPHTLGLDKDEGRGREECGSDGRLPFFFSRSAANCDNDCIYSFIGS